MSTTSSKDTVLLLGGTGKVSSRIAPILSSNNHVVLLASRSGASSLLPNTYGVKFDWLDQTTYSKPFAFLPSPISAVFLVSPPIMDFLPPMKKFIHVAIGHGVKRFVLLSGSLLDVGDGPIMEKVAGYIAGLGVEFAILRPSWFMENFSEMEHLPTIRDEDCIITAAGEGKLPFVSADDIASVAYHALTDKEPHNTDHLILGPELLSYDDVADILTKALGRRITHKKITEDDAAAAMQASGIPEDHARLLAGLGTAVKEGKEERMNDVVREVTGRTPKRFCEYVDECVSNGIWTKK